MSRNTLTFAALAVTGVLVSGLAQARSDVQWSVSIGGPVAVSVYSQPPDYYSQPLVYYRQPPVYYSQPPVYYSEPPVYYSQPVYLPAQPVYPRQRYQQPTRWDIDGDGVPNRYDRVYNPRWDRDGDGIPNRHDRHDHGRQARDIGYAPHAPYQLEGQRWRGR